MLDFLEKFFQDIRQNGEYSRLFVTIATLVGIIWIMVNMLKLIYYTCQFFFLYVWAQLVHHDLKKKYGRWVVISGGTDGIGLGFAKELASRGHSLIIIGRNAQKLANVKMQLSEISKSPDEIVTIKIDFSEATSRDYDRVGREMQLDTREIGILINNVGTFAGEIKRYLQTDSEEIRAAVEVNVMSNLMMTKLVMPNMIKNGRGLILNISSAIAHLPSPFFGVYGPCKSFVSKFSKSLQLEYSNYPVDIINYSTGPVNTKMFRECFKENSSTDSFFPDPDAYAKSALALAAASGTCGDTAGYWTHTLMNKFSSLLVEIGLWSFLINRNIKLYSQTNKLSPPPGRKMKPPSEQS